MSDSDKIIPQEKCGESIIMRLIRDVVLACMVIYVAGVLHDGFVPDARAGWGVKLDSFSTVGLVFFSVAWAAVVASTAIYDGLKSARMARLTNKVNGHKEED